MSTISRKYDFQPGTKVFSSQVDEEFNQLVDAHNDHETRIAGVEGTFATQYYTKAQVDNVIVNSQFGTPPLGGVNTAYISDLAVTTPKYADGSVTTAKMAAGSVTHDRLSTSEQAASAAGALFAYATQGGW